jgi:SAM-dependent methyltransferase
MAAVSDGLIAPGANVVEIGCGTGTNAVWLALQGFVVTATDVSATALAAARAKADEAGVAVRFLEASSPPQEGAFDVVFDRGVFHIFATDGERDAFAAAAAAALREGGLWLGLHGSADGPPRDHGPPRLSVRDVAIAVEPWFEILSLIDTVFDVNHVASPRGWWLVARKRTFYPTG